MMQITMPSTCLQPELVICYRKADDRTNIDEVVKQSLLYSIDKHGLEGEVTFGDPSKPFPDLSVELHFPSEPVLGRPVRIPKKEIFDVDCRNWYAMPVGRDLSASHRMACGARGGELRLQRFTYSLALRFLFIAIVTPFKDPQTGEHTRRLCFIPWHWLWEQYTRRSGVPVFRPSECPSFSEDSEQLYDIDVNQLLKVKAEWERSIKRA